MQLAESPGVIAELDVLKSRIEQLVVLTGTSAIPKKNQAKIETAEILTIIINK